EVGEAPGIRAGGVIEHHLREIEIECLPNDVPEMIPADISAMEIGDMLRVGDIAVPQGVTFLTAADTPVISVITPAALRVEAELAELREGQERVLLVTSTRYMNESGPSYAGLAKKHDVPPERIVAVHDELEIPPGELHVKLGGGSGGHNGLKSLTQALRTPEYH